ncbi:MAG TPA: methyltransferase domain-containing protein [Armatimonadota bacterium]|jgi:SAM-dependent methyltransferase
MTLDDFLSLQGAQGQEILRELAGEALAGGDLLPALERYRRRYPAELVHAAVELTQLRRRGAAKFSRAGEMFFTGDGLEMASSEVVARYSARRFAGLARVCDLCCGIGGDALALAEVAGRVIAVDRDPLALAMARANARVLTLERQLDFVQADVTAWTTHALPLLGRPEAIFIDPSRREARAAAKRPEAYSPPLSWCLGLTPVAPRVAIKVSPALDYEEVLAGMKAEVEIISLAGECKEAVYWLGAFHTCARRATRLPGGETLTEEGAHSDALGPVGAWLYEPDSAAIRAHLVQRLAGEYALWRIEPTIAYLSGNTEVTSPWLTGYRVLETVPWSLKRLNAALAARSVGTVVIKKRGFPLTPEELRPKLKLKGTNRATLICTQAQGHAVVILAETPAA